MLPRHLNHKNAGREEEREGEKDKTIKSMLITNEQSNKAINL